MHDRILLILTAPNGPPIGRRSRGEDEGRIGVGVAGQGDVKLDVDGPDDLDIVADIAPGRGGKGEGEAVDRRQARGQQALEDILRGGLIAIATQAIA